MDKKDEVCAGELKKDGCVLWISEHFDGKEKRRELLRRYLLRRLEQRP